MVERKCIVKRETDEKENLVRFVLGPENKVYPDIREKLPGRGVWVTANRNSVQEAIEKKLFARAFKSKCKIEEDLPDKIDELLLAQCLNYLSLAKKAGELISGFDKISAALSKNKVDMLIQASDGASDGHSKLEKKYSAIADNPIIVRLFSSEQMNLALGGTNVIHAAITRGMLTARMRDCISRLTRFRA